MNRMVIGLASALFVSMLVIAYLIGRMSAEERAVREVLVEKPVIQERIVEVPVERVVERPLAERTVAERPAAEETFVERREVRVVEKPADRPPAQDNAAIAAYFAQTRALQAAGSGSPNMAANDLMEGAVRGDTSGFDTLLSNLTRLEGEAKAIVPPPECREHHRELLALTEESREVLTQMRDAIAVKKLDALASIAMRAQAMQARVEALQAAEKRLLGE